MALSNFVIMNDPRSGDVTAYKSCKQCWLNSVNRIREGNLAGATDRKLGGVDRQRECVIRMIMPDKGRIHRSRDINYEGSH